MCCLKFEDATYKGGCPKAAGGTPPCAKGPAAEEPATDLQEMVFEEEAPSEEGF
jgi:hypothetical protein